VIEGYDVAIEMTADTLMAGGTPGFPATVNVGQSDVLAMTGTLRHPGGMGVARVDLAGFSVRFQDAQRSPVVPGSVVGRVRVIVDAVEVADITGVPGTGDNVPIALAGIDLEAGESLDIELRVDFAAGAPQSFIELVIDPGAITAVDGNLGVPVTVAADAGASLPITSGLTQLLPPATELQAALTDDMPAVLTGGATDLRVCAVELANTAAAGSGNIRVDHFVLSASTGSGEPAAIGRAVARVHLYAGGAPLASSAPLGADSTTAWMDINPPLELEPGQPIELEVRLDLQSDPGVNSLRVGIDEAGVGVVQLPPE
jgi:hypothetical protein